MTFPDDKNVFKIKDLLKYFLKEITVNLSDNCINCNKKKYKIHKKINFNILNDILILSLQRMDPYLSVKNDAKVSFEDILDLIEFYDNEPNLKELKYQLFGIINHHGSITFGHYYSYIKLENVWFEFNDSNVNKLDSIEYISSKAYIFIYQKIRSK